MFEGRWYSRDGRTAMKSATSLKGGITAECKSWLRVPCCDQGCDGGMGATGERCRGMEPAGMSVVNDKGSWWRWVGLRVAGTAGAEKMGLKRLARPCAQQRKVME